jgi:uncharacterized protein YyaL (SSP411 family)
VRRLCVDTQWLSRWFAAAVAVGAVVLVGTPDVWAYAHHASKVRFVEHSPQTFETARRERKPVFLLISAVWCYWCKYFDQHVLRDDEIARFLNRRYLSVFVDHDRRLDIARRYARGLPTIVLFDLDGGVRQSFAGVLTKEDFLSVLKRVESDIRTERAPRAPPARPMVASGPVPVTLETYEQLRRGLLTLLDERLDTTHGGFGTGDKHPHARLLAYLLEQHAAGGDRRYLAAVVRSLDAILGGIHDRVEGGFFRYAEGREWSRPHYEKLVHLNASLAAVFGEAHRLTGNPRYKDAAESTLAYLLRTFHDARAGGFYGSQTADPAYYQLALADRRATRGPPVNRDKVTAWNAEATLAFISLGQSSGRKDVVDVALRTLAFMRRSVVTEKGVFHIHEYRTGRGQLLGEVEPNAWAALAFLDGYRVSRVEAYREAAERILGYVMAERFDAARGVFAEQGDSRHSLYADGLMAEALVRAHGLTGRAEYLEAARKTLAALGSVAHALLVDDDDPATMARVADAVFYLRAYGQLVKTP